MTKKVLNLGTAWFASNALSAFASAGIAMTLALALVAELFRWHGVLLIDLWVPLFTLTWLGWQIFQNLTDKRKSAPKLPPATLPALIFVLIGGASLLLNSADMSFAEFAEAAFYGIRWACMFILSIIVFNQKKAARGHTLWMIFAFATLLALAGFVQLHYFPSFEQYETLGWDPHVGRLLSTWFDPNFVGAFLTFAFLLLLGAAFQKPKWRVPLAILGAIILTALALTFSRSAYLALLAGLFVFGIIKSRKLLLVGLLVLLLAVGLSGSVRARVNSLVDSAQSVLTDNYTLPDQSSRLRFDSWAEAWTLFAEKPILGHGYNRYQDASIQYKLTADPTSHAASGSDSSLLTVLATTGLAGFAAFLAVYLILALQAWQSRRNAYAAAFLSALSALFVSSIFVNGMLFPLFMAPFWLAAGLLPPLKFPRK